MFFLLSRRLPRSYPMLALIATNLVISMPAPPSRRSDDITGDSRNGFSNVPKILEIQLPLKIATKDDLVAWARYVMGLMASKINITLTTVKDTPSKTTGSFRAPENVRGFDNAKQSQNSRNSAFQRFDASKSISGVEQFANTKSFENSRYAENVRNLGHVSNFDRARLPASVSILDNGRVENARNPQRNGIAQLSKDKVYASSQLPSLTVGGVTTKTLFSNHGNLAISDTTVPSPLEVTANINVARARIKEPSFKGTLDRTNFLKAGDQQQFVPQFPDFGPAIDVRPNDIFRNTNAVSPPTRTYLPVTTTADSIKFPTDPFVTRYFFDGLERNISSNIGVLASEITFTTQNPLYFGDEIALPVKSFDHQPHQRNLSSMKPLFQVPFEAVITFTREEPTQTTTSRSEETNYFTVVPTREPADQFPPYFDSNFTLTNESGQINVVFDDSGQVAQPTDSGKKDERDRKKEKSKKESSKKEKEKSKKLSPFGQLLKSFVALRRNNTPSEQLTPPPLNQQTTSTTQRVPARQRVPPPQRTQLYPPQRPPSASRQGRRNQTSLAQQVEDDDDSGSKEDSTSKEETDSGEDNGSKGDEGSKGGSREGSKSEENGDVESKEGNGNGGSNESASNENDYDDSEEDEGGGGSIKVILDLLPLVTPILEDLSDPDSNTDITDVLELGIPILQDLSEGDDENEPLDIPGVLVPILLQLSGGPNGDRDSAAILTPVLQLIAPLIGPLVGPLVLPLSRQISNPPGEGGSSSGDLVKAVLGPLLEPVGNGKMTALSNLIANVVSSLSKTSTGGKSDLMSLVKAVVAGTVAGTSAGSSGQKDSYGTPTGYGAVSSYGGAPPSYSYPKAPPKHPNSLNLLGSSVKDILNAILKVVASLVSAITTILGASSNSSNQPSHHPPPYHTSPPRTYGAPNPNMVPLSESVSITTSRPERLVRL
ncbi:PREDICTED: uncharacterized protein LOC108555289 [Eufriesea mexicana]|uniref:uncharacterized protein LOC108555289 n=1 Tax=Eufriesea mexicana TaxID=516756 RepID=UPI00083BB70D|nr:PREDICTED: uncharacterized protein LOC108555289 [Eufriesea mexicana]